MVDGTLGPASAQPLLLNASDDGSASSQLIEEEKTNSTGHSSSIVEEFELPKQPMLKRTSSKKIKKESSVFGVFKKATSSIGAALRVKDIVSVFTGEEEEEKVVEEEKDLTEQQRFMQELVSHVQT